MSKDKKKKFILLFLFILSTFHIHSGIVDNIQTFFLKEKSSAENFVITTFAFYLFGKGIPYIVKRCRKKIYTSKSFKFEISGKQLKELTNLNLPIEGKNKDATTRIRVAAILYPALSKLRGVLRTYDDTGMFDDIVFKIKAALDRSYPDAAVTDKGKIRLSAPHLAPLPDTEILGTLYHEIGHIKNGDVKKDYLLQLSLPLIIASSFCSTSYVFDMVIYDYYKAEPSSLCFMSKLLLTNGLCVLLSRSLVQYHNHLKEYKADQFAVGNPIACEGLIASFKRDLRNENPPPRDFFGKVQSWYRGYFDSATHPDARLRIERLKQQ